MRRRRRLLVATGLLVIAVIVVLLVSGGSSGNRSYTIKSEAMAPTLRTGEKLTIDTRARNPGLGAIVVFYGPRTGGLNDVCANPDQGLGHPQACGKAWTTRSGTILVKRVVGLPGDSISMAGGYVIRDGRRETDRYVQPCQDSYCTFPDPITVPAGEYFVLGDNRGASLDSRFFGPVPRAWLIGTDTGS